MTLCINAVVWSYYSFKWWAYIFLGIFIQTLEGPEHSICSEQSFLENTQSWNLKPFIALQRQLNRAFHSYLFLDCLWPFYINSWQRYNLKNAQFGCSNLIYHAGKYNERRGMKLKDGCLRNCFFGNFYMNWSVPSGLMCTLKSITHLFLNLLYFLMQFTSLKNNCKMSSEKSEEKNLSKCKFFFLM